MYEIQLLCDNMGCHATRKIKVQFSVWGTELYEPGYYY